MLICNRFVASDGNPNDFLGFDVDIDGGVALVGAPQDDDLGTSSGTAFLFDTNTGAQIAKLLADDGAANERFGEAVDVDGNRAIVGAPTLSGGAGTVYVFDVTTGAQILKLFGNETTTRFGSDVAIHGISLTCFGHIDRTHSAIG